MLEPLETRIAPATLNLSSTLLGYTATSGIINNLSIELSAGVYSFTDTGETITLNAAAITAGFTGNGTNTVTGPASALDTIRIDLSNGGDTLNVNGLGDALSVLDSDPGIDTVNVSTGADVVNDTVSIDAEVVNITGITGLTRLTLETDTLAVNGNVGLTGPLTISPLTAGRPINLGTETVGSLSLTTTELGRFSAPTSILIGAVDAGNITLSAALNFTNTSSLTLRTGGNVSASGAGAVVVPALALDVVGTVSLGGAGSDVDTLAGEVDGTSVIGSTFSFADADGFQIGTVGSVTGLSGEDIVLGGGSIAQAAGAAITGTTLTLTGAGPFVLNTETNDVAGLAANVTGQIQYTDANALAIGNILTVGGITTSNEQVTIRTLAGDLTVQNGNASAAADISTGTGAISLAAGVDGSDFAIILDANAGLSARSVTLRADTINVGAAIVTTQAVRLFAFEASTTIGLGSGDNVALLGLTDAELDRITTPDLTIGSGNANAMTVNAPISLSSTDVLTLNATTVIGAGSISVVTLEFNVTGAFNLPGANDVDELLGVTTTGPITFTDTDGFVAGSDPSGPNVALSSSDPTQRTLNAGSGAVSILSGDALAFAIDGATPGTGHDQWTVTGGVNLTGAGLTISSSFTPAPGTEIVLISNDGVDAVVGTFQGLDEGELFAASGRLFVISYAGGDGNDVTLTAPAALAVTLANGGKTATFTDVDGDLVTVKTTKGAFDGSEFIGIATGGAGGGQLFRLKLDADFTGANITMTAKRGPNGGNGFVNIGQLDAAGVDLGSVSIAGDLGSITAGMIGGDAKVPAIKSLTVQSMGLLGISTQGPTGVPNSSLQGALGKLVVKDDYRNVRLEVFDADGRIGSAQIGGSIVATSEFTELSALAGIGSLKVGGDIRASQTDFVLIRTNSGALGAVTVGGSIYSPSADEPVQFFAFGQPTAPTKGLDLAIKSLTVKGSVENAQILTGLGPFNADASIGSITVGGDWIASSAIAGASTGVDDLFGSADDAKIAFAGTRDNPNLFSTIGSFTVKGQAFGTAGTTTDMFGVVAERIGKAKVGGRTFAFTSGATPEAFFAAPTPDGEGAENPAFDFTIRELGSTTPTPNFGGANLDISSDGKTATFTDVDGDLVTVKRGAGTFVAGDFQIAVNTAGGGQLGTLTLTAAPTSAPFDLTITAKPGTNGGNGFVNIGRIAATGRDLGAVLIVGEVEEFAAGDNDPTKPGVRSLTVQSLGELAGDFVGNSGGEIEIGVDAGAITVRTAVRGTDVDVVRNLAALTVGGSVTDGANLDADNFRVVKIGGGLLDSSSISANETIGALTIGGDVVGQSATGNKISAGGPATLPPRGPALAIASLAIKGSVESALIVVGGFANPDASIGKIAVGRAWLGSNVLAGAKVQPDDFYGDGTDVSADAVPGDPARFSTIASLVIKGQALGSAATNDTFGIVAEQIGNVQIGRVKLVFDKGERDAADAFALGPTGPGATGLSSDFFIREITV